MALVMEREVIFIAQKPIRKITINRETIAGSILPCQIQIYTVDIIAKFYKRAQQDIAFGSAHRRHGFSSMPQKCPKESTNKNYF